MKVWNEVTEKIDELMDKAKAAESEVEKEMICNQIDALLWVIGDRSGKPI